MKFIVNSQTLVKQLQAISGVLTNNNTVPIINCFLFHLEEGELTVRTTDLETTLITTLEAETADLEEKRDVAIPSRLLLDILKTLDDAPLSVTIDNSSFAIEITSGEGKYRLAGNDPETFPTMPQKNDTTVVTLPSTAIVNAISKTVFAASNDEMRQQMTGIFCEMTPDGVTFVATDAHKLVRYRRNDVHSEVSTNFILPRKPVTIVKNILGSRKEECPVTLEYNSTNVFFTFDNYYIICRLVDGRYPNYEAAIPKENPNHLTIDRMSFLNTLRRVGLFANQSTHQVRLSITDRMVTISAEDLEFSNNATEKMPCQYEGNPMDIGFNAKFLAEMLSSLDSEQVFMELSHPSRAGILFPVTEEGDPENILMLVMPVMLAN